jgi:hypothetical protein
MKVPSVRPFDFELSQTARSDGKEKSPGRKRFAGAPGADQDKPPVGKEMSRTHNAMTASGRIDLDQSRTMR